MAKLKTNAARRTADAYSRAIVGLEEAAYALVLLTASQDRDHAESAAFSLLSMGQVGLDALVFALDRTPDVGLRGRIVALICGAAYSHDASILPILRRLVESDDLDPVQQTNVRSAFAEALARATRPGCHEAAAPASSGASDQTSAAEAPDPGK